MKAPLKRAHLWLGCAASAVLVAVAACLPAALSLRFALGGAAMVALIMLASVLASGGHATDGEHPVDWAKAKSFTDLLKNAVEVAAIVYGAAWAYNKYVASEAPTLEANVHTKSEGLRSQRSRKGDCFVIFPVFAENLGVTPVTLKTVHVDVYEYVPSELRNIDFDAITKRGIQPLAELSRNLTPNASLYEKNSWRHDIEWVMDPKEGREYYFRGQYTLTAEGKPDVHKISTAWDALCEAPSPGIGAPEAGPPP
jgi:hypothetical protein